MRPLRESSSNDDGTQAAGLPCNKIPIALAGSGGMADPAGLAMIKLYPQSNASNPGLGINFTNTPVRKLNEGEFDIRLDHNFSAKDSVFARFSYDQAFSFVPGGSPGFAEQGAFASTQNITNHGRNVAVSEQHLFLPIRSTSLPLATIEFLTTSLPSAPEPAKPRN